jgi:hypothetical protein
MDPLLRSALPLSVNLNRYATKVATHIKLPLSRSVLPESRPFEVTRGGVRKREWEVCDRGGKMRESTCDPLRLRHWRKAYRRCLYLRPPYVPGSSLLQIYDQWTLDRTEGKRFFTSTHLLWSQAPRWGDLRLASQWVHSPIYSHPWSSPLETYFISIHELIPRIR